VAKRGKNAERGKPDIVLFSPWRAANYVIEHWPKDKDFSSGKQRRT
jgi:hypothetical protein